MSNDNPYDTLGVESTASDDDIRKAYLAKARKLHPDTNSNTTEEDQETFKKVTGAYMVLKDPAKRARFDREGDVEEEDSEVQAIAIIIQSTLISLVSAMDADDPFDLEHGAAITDLKATMKAKLSKKVKAFKKTISSLKKQRKALRVQRKRFKRKSNKSPLHIDVIDTFFKEQLERTVRDIADTKVQRHNHKMAIQYLEDFDYTYEESYDADFEEAIAVKIQNGELDHLIEQAKEAAQDEAEAHDDNADEGGDWNEVDESEETPANAKGKASPVFFGDRPRRSGFRGSSDKPWWEF